MKISTVVRNIRLKSVLSLKHLKVEEIAKKLGISIEQVRYYLNRQTRLKSLQKWLDGHEDYYKQKYKRLHELWLKTGTLCVICQKTAKIRHFPLETDTVFQDVYNHNLVDKIPALVAQSVPMCVSCHKKLHLGGIVRKDLWDGPLEVPTFDKRHRATGIRKVY